MTCASRRLLLAAGLGAALAGRAARGAEPGYEWRPWPRGRAVPKLELPHVDGSRWRLADARGQALLINFWATWCEPCRAEMPSLLELARRRQADGLRVLAVNYREGEPAVRRFAEALQLHELTLLLDREGRAAREWTPRIFPSTVLIDRRGRPLGVLVGEINWRGSDASTRIDALLSVR